MASILLIYSTVDGHTRLICERLCDVVTDAGHDAMLLSLDDGPDIDLKQFDVIVIGASIRYGRHRANVNTFIQRHEEVLEALPSALFSVSLVARKPNRNRADTNPYLKRFLPTIDWRPDLIGVFAGELNYPKYRFWDRQMIRMIMWMTGGPTHPDSVVDYTDWQQVDGFGRQVCELVRDPG